MTNKIKILIDAELFYAKQRVDFLSRMAQEAADMPGLSVYSMRHALKSHGLAVVESDALRVALDQFDIAEQTDDDGLGVFADSSDTSKAKAAILEAWEASK
jgi:hypothetical protein